MQPREDKEWSEELYLLNTPEASPLTLMTVFQFAFLTCCALGSNWTVTVWQQSFL